MPEVDDGVVKILGHGVACAKFCAVGGDDLASGGVMVAEDAWIALRVRVRNCS